MDLTSLPILEKVNKSLQPRTSTVKIDDFTTLASKSFDYAFEGESKFYPFNKPTKIPSEFNIGLIVGASGTGKSTLLNEFGKEEEISWNPTRAIISHFDNPEIGVNKLSAVGLNSIPTWCRPYQVLSNGEKFRADISRKIKDNAVIDEFTSVVDRNVAKACSTSVSKYIKKNDIKNVVFSSCHFDIIEWLQPDWIFDANVGILYNGRSVRQPRIELNIYQCGQKDIWSMFKNHHYLSEDLNKASRCYIATWNGNIVAFGSALPMPSGTLKNAWREHRVVVLPDYQGMGIGVALSDALGELYISQGLKYYSRSAHIRFGQHRNKSPKWIENATNKMQRKESHHNQNYNNWLIDTKRICFSHQYVGEDYTKKQHFNILFDITKEIDYEQFKNKMIPIIEAIGKKHFLVFWSGKTKTEDTVAEKLSKEYGIRNELYPINRIAKGDMSMIDAVIDIGNNPKIKEMCIANKKHYKFLDI